MGLCASGPDEPVEESIEDSTEVKLPARKRPPKKSKPPFTQKTTEVSASGRHFGCSEMQGYRLEMEDAHIVNGAIAGAEDHAIFAVFDGHGGDFSARFSEVHLVELLRKQSGWADYLKTGNVEVLSEAFEKAFFALDKALLAAVPRGDYSGCTAVVALITPTHLVCANAGDSRCVLRSKGKAKALSEDHKPSDPKELRRIRAAGGDVKKDRVDGSLAVSRALGDFEFKNQKLAPEKQKVTAQPDVVIHERCAEDQLLVLACDGIWDVIDNEGCLKLLERNIEKYETKGMPNAIGKACEDVLDKCLNLRSTDNMSLMAIQLDGV